MKYLSACAVSISLLLSGCASVSETYAPDGSKAYALNCSGTARDWGLCYEEAGNICKERGYNVVTMNGEQGSQASGFSNTEMAAIQSSSLHFRTMTIACK